MRARTSPGTARSQIQASAQRTAERCRGDAVRVRVATFDQAEHGLTYEGLAETDVLTWWGHAAHDRVLDEVVDRVHHRVLDGMGLIALHSAHAIGVELMVRPWRSIIIR